MKRSFISRFLGIFGFNKVETTQNPSPEQPPVPERLSPIMALTPQRLLADPMSRDWFWSIVDGSIDADETAQVDKLRVALEAMEDQDLVDFIALYRDAHGQLYSWRLWAAAYLMNGGCSDDGFIDFRSWLIAQGREAAERAMADAESLADLAVKEGSAFFEEFGYVADEVFDGRSGGAYPSFDMPTEPPEPAEPEWDFDFDDHGQMRQRLPRLAALYL